MSDNRRFPNRWLPDARGGWNGPPDTWECGPKGGAVIWFKPNGSVHLMRDSQSLKADWKSARLGAVDENIKHGAPLDPVVFELATSIPFKKNEASAKSVELPLGIDDGKSETIRPEVYQSIGERLKKIGIDPKRDLNRMPPLDLSYRRQMHRSAKEAKGAKGTAIDLNLPNVFTALGEILSETEEHKFKRKCDKLMRKIKAAWAIRQKVSTHQEFLDELKKLAKKLGHPPTKGQLAGELGLENNAQRMSQLCRELGYDWLPTEKPGPKPWKRRSR